MWHGLASLVRPAPPGDEGLVEAAPSVPLREVFRRFWPYARPLRGWLLVGTLLGCVGPSLEGAGIWLTKVLVDRVLVPGDFSAFVPLAGLYLLITLGTGVVGFVGAYLTAWTGESFLHRLRTAVFAHLQTLSVGFFDRRRLGDVISRFTGDIVAIESLVLSGVAALAESLVKILLFGALLFFLDWQLALVSLLVAPLLWLAARSFAQRIRDASAEVRRRSGSIASVVEESLGNAPLVQAYGRESAEVRRFTRQSLAAVAAALRATKISAAFSPLVELLEVVAVLSIVGAGAWQLSTGRITLGELLAFLLYLSMMYGPVTGLGHMSTAVFAATAGAERVLELLDQEPEVRAPARPVPLSRAVGRITFEDVRFCYPGTTTPVLDGISFTAEPGTTTALVGVSGAGKSTLARLVLRLYDPTGGRITLDGHDLRDLDPQELRANIAFVLQETLLMDDTVTENIRAGRPDATFAEIVRAARAADADEFIERLPLGYGTRVGQRGRLLSGGQRQRVAIARAVVRDAPVLVLDEPTASLDAATTARVLEPMRRLAAGRTTLLISHDLLTVAEADQVLYLEDGRVAEAGTHEELLRAEGGYARLYRTRREAVPARPERPPVPPPWDDGPPPWADGPPPWDDGPPPWGDGPPPWGDGPPPWGDGPPPWGDGPPPWADGPPPWADDLPDPAPRPDRRHRVPPLGGRP